MIEVNDTIYNVDLDVFENTETIFIEVGDINGIQDAPIDGQIYGRKDASWQVVTEVSSADDITETATRVFVTPAEKTAITHTNRSILDAITESFTSALKNAYDGAVNWINTNGSSLINHLTRTDNPHNVTKIQIGLSDVDNTADLNKPISTVTQTALNNKVDKTEWIDYSALSTIVGIGVFAEKQIKYKIIDGYMFVDFSIFGTSTSGQFSFTVPFASAEGFTIYRPTGYLQNMGGIVNNFGRSSIATGSNVVILRRDAAGFNDWATTSSKGTNGQITFKI